MTDEEKKMLDKSQSTLYEEMREAAEAHRQVFLFFLWRFSSHGIGSY